MSDLLTFHERKLRTSHFSEAVQVVATNKVFVRLRAHVFFQLCCVWCVCVRVYVLCGGECVCV
jgi:hypothetical protein